MKLSIEWDRKLDSGSVELAPSDMIAMLEDMDEDAIFELLILVAAAYHRPKSLLKYQLEEALKQVFTDEDTFYGDSPTPDTDELLKRLDAFMEMFKGYGTP